ncbi:MAG: acyl-CoA dehydratase activase [Eubacteriales bacterium]|nr:acyl-CoA dehydratase activase [Eubacteriales bacterium]
MSSSKKYWIGVDVGSTTTKTVILRGEDEHIIFSRYIRHHAELQKSVCALLKEGKEYISEGSEVRIAFTGSGSKPLADAAGVPFVQEVVANSLAVMKYYPTAKTAIELGGQDAKVIFFRKNTKTGRLEVSDMRMNGSCAGGTGAFIDEIASLLKVAPEEYEALAEKGTQLYDISGRCGVYAKTDIQPLLNQGVAKEDIALSALHAISKQTIGGLAQGLTMEPPIIFEGGPLCFHPMLVQAFREKLNLQDEDILIPEKPELMVAIGAALYAGNGSGQSKDASADNVRTGGFDLDLIIRKLSIQRQIASDAADGALSRPFFESEDEYRAFLARHPLYEDKNIFRRLDPAEDGAVIDVYLGVDCGSTTTKFVALDEKERILYSFYANNGGDPISVLRRGLLEMEEKYSREGISLHVLGMATTGYGELLAAKAFRADDHIVETVAHAGASAKYLEDATFILDIGGQDMKAIWLDDGIITDIVVNEACSAGCGSFLENFAKNMGVPTNEIAERAFRAKHPAELGSRCTVFMNSRIITEQKNGKEVNEILAGLCRSIIENVFTKVIRISSLDSLGERVVVQGGTFCNDAVLRAMEQYIGREVVRAPYPGLMGAIGAAYAAKKKMARTGQESSFIGFEALRTFSFTQVNGLVCGGCENHCRRSVVTFSTGDFWITGNRCERGGVLNPGELEAFLAGRQQETPPEKAAKPAAAGRAAPSEKTAEPAAAGRTAHPEKTERLKSAVPESGSAEKVMPKSAEQEKNRNPVKSPRPAARPRKGIDLFKVRKTFLTREYPYKQVDGRKGITIGLPFVLAYWETLPFWRTFWSALGFDVLVSPESTRAIFEDGLHAVTSDTECFPGKLVHGHIRWLEKHGADRIFFPSISTRKSENTEKTSVSMCGIVKGFPFVIKNSDNPEERGSVIYDAPVFFWYTDTDRERQLSRFVSDTFGIKKNLVRKAIREGDAAQSAFREKLQEQGKKVLEQLEAEAAAFAGHAESGNGQKAQRAAVTEKKFPMAVVLAARPYQNDDLVNHDIPGMFTEQGISVLPADAIPGLTDLDLKNSRLDVVNNFHARMLSSAIYAAAHENLEYVQIVSFGCGHDAYLSDEIIRIMKEISGKTPLILKVDESDIRGPLSIRIRSFLSTVQMKRERDARSAERQTEGQEVFPPQRHELSEMPRTLPGASRRRPGEVRPLRDPYPQKFRKEDLDSGEYIVFVPNTSHAFSRLMAAVFAEQKIKTVPLPIGRERAIELGKRYVHNDICFPAQVVIGEALEALEKPEYAGRKRAVMMGKYIGCCRLTHYGALLRKALDDAGYSDVPILTNDDEDYHDLHPGFKPSLRAYVKISFALPMIDALEDLLRKMRPYETVKGSAEKTFERAMDLLIDAIENGGVSQMKKAFKKAVRLMKTVEYDRSSPRPQVLIVGEYLLNFHPGANHEIERYLEQNGFEIVEAKMADVIQKTYFVREAQAAEFGVKKPVSERTFLKIVGQVFDMSHDFVNAAAKEHPLFVPAAKLRDVAKASDPVLPHAYDSGEGILIPAEIIERAREGVRAFVILQPFGCIPNHVVGRGIAGRIKKMFPDIQLLPLDYDPDVSFTNVENRLQMLVMNIRSSMEPGV